MIVQVLAHTADGVAAHFPLAAVQVEHPHPGVGNSGGQDQHHAVPADALMPVGQADTEALRVFDVQAHTVEVNVIVAAALHFSEGMAPPSPAQAVEVDKLGAVDRIPAAQAVRHGVRRVEGGQAGDASFG